MSKAWAKGSTRAWRTTRARVLAAAQHRCQLKLDGCTTIATQAHHQRGKAQGDVDLVACCQSCNLKVGDPTRHDPAPTPRTQW